MKSERQYIAAALHPIEFDDSAKCPVCGVGHLRAKLREATLEFAGREESYEKRYLQCDHCSAIRTPPEDEKANTLCINDAKLRALGSPTRAELRKMRAHWRLTQDMAGRLLGVGPTAFSKYENGDVVPAAPTARLLHLVCHSPEAIPQLAEHYRVELRERPGVLRGNCVKKAAQPVNPDHLHFTLNIAQPSSGIVGTMYLGSLPVEGAVVRGRRGQG